MSTSYSPSSPATRTQAFARVIGPFVAFVTAVIIYRAPNMDDLFSGFFNNPVIVWITGAMLLLCGLIIVSFHQYWRNLGAILISLFGWLLILRGALLIVVPHWYERVGAEAMPHMAMIRTGFAVMTLIGLYLAYIGWIARPHDE